MRKWAYMGLPHTGGTYSVFKNLREGLLKHDIKLSWIACGAGCAQRLAGGEFDSELPLGTVVAPTESNEARQGAALIKFFEKGEYEGVFINALCGRLATNFVRYLDSRIPRIMIVHTISVGTYAAAQAVRDYVHATVGVSPRIAADLIAYKGFDGRWTVSIPNAVAAEKFTAVERADSSGPLRVLSLGRVEDSAKGCLLLPKIISEVQRLGAETEWRIAGDGPSLKELKRRCSRFANVQFLGRIPYEHVPEAFTNADVYIFPSRYEGFGISLVEAMASGCVPVASDIGGVTDSIVEHGRTGYLFPIGNYRRAAEYIWRLTDEREKIREMATAAKQSVSYRFSIDSVAKQYVHLIERVLANPRPSRPALNVEKWKYPYGLRIGLRTYLPESMKVRLRALRESIHTRIT